MNVDQLIDIAAGAICGIACARCYYLTKAHRRKERFLPRRVCILNRDRL